MKSTVNFYSLENNQEISLSVCQLAQELYKLGEQIIIVDNDENLEKIDSLLWVFEQNSFLPHKKYNIGDELDTPIILLSQNYLNNLLVFNKYGSIINNYIKPILETEENVKIYEFVQNNEEKKIISRQKFSMYKKNNFIVNHSKYNGKTI